MISHNIKFAEKIRISYTQIHATYFFRNPQKLNWNVYQSFCFSFPFIFFFIYKWVFLRSILTIIDNNRIVVTARDECVAIRWEIYSVYAICILSEYLSYPIIANNIICELHCGV